jgi:hypothetical protein
MAKQNGIMILENVGGVDEDLCGQSENLTTNSSNVESIHLQRDNDHVDNDELHLVTIVIIAAQAQKWKPNNNNSICWGIFVGSDNLSLSS